MALSLRRCFICVISKAVSLVLSLRWFHQCYLRGSISSMLYLGRCFIDVISGTIFQRCYHWGDVSTVLCPRQDCVSSVLSLGRCFIDCISNAVYNGVISKTVFHWCYLRGDVSLVLSRGLCFIVGKIFEVVFRVCYFKGSLSSYHTSIHLTSYI